MLSSTTKEDRYQSLYLGLELTMIDFKINSFRETVPLKPGKRKGTINKIP
jgi:hypothetical protein